MDLCPPISPHLYIVVASTKNQHEILCTDDMIIDSLLTTLSYYSNLNINNDNDKLIFVDFIDTVYKFGIYDDFYHSQNIMEIILIFLIKI